MGSTSKARSNPFIADASRSSFSGPPVAAGRSLSGGKAMAVFHCFWGLGKQLGLR